MATFHDGPVAIGAARRPLANTRMRWARVPTFDPDYLAELEELIGSYVNFPWFHVEGAKDVAQTWDRETPVPESIDDYWDGAGLEPLLVDIDTGEAEPYEDVDGYTIVS